MAGSIQDSSADILLMAGELAQLPDLLDHVLSLPPVPAGRIVVLGPGESGTANSEARRTSVTQHGAVLGAYLASRNLLETEGFSLVTRGLVRALGEGGRSGQIAALEAAGRPMALVAGFGDGAAS